MQIIISNVNSLNTPIKKKTLSNNKKGRLNHCVLCMRKTLNMPTRIKSKRMERDIPCKH